MESPKLSMDPASEIRRSMLTAQATAYISVPAEKMEEAAAMLERVTVLTPAWRPPASARYSFKVTPTVLVLRACYASPGGALEVRTNGADAIYLLERPAPVEPPEALRLVQAMFGERYVIQPPVAAPPWRRIEFQPPDSEGIRFIVHPSLDPSLLWPPWYMFVTMVLGGRLNGTRFEVASTYRDPVTFTSSRAGQPYWNPTYLDLTPWQEAAAAAAARR